MTRILLSLGISLSLNVAAQAGDTWPQFRGPGGQGHVDAMDVPLEWSETENIRWKTPLPGHGHSSPVVAGNQIWVTTAITKPASEEERIRRTAGLPNQDDFELAGELSLHAICIDRRTGSILRDLELFTIEDPDPVHAINSYASPTAILEPGRVYVHFGTYGTACLDSDSGKVLWKKRFPIAHNVGPGSSPAIVGDLLIVPCDGADKQFVVALDKTTGDVVWERERPPIRSKNGDQRKSFCTPLAIDWQGQTQIVVPGSQWIVAYEPQSGDELWRLDFGSGYSVVPRPVASDSHLYFSTGFNRAEIVAVKLGGQGDITESHLDWRVARQAPTMPSPLLIGDRLFTVSDGGVAVCLDAATGEIHWQKRLGGNYSASPLLIDNRIYFFNREGLATILTDGPTKPEVVAENELDGAIFATPAVLDGEIILRTETHVYAIGK